MFKHLITAFRLRTLPLAFSCVIMGSALADLDGNFNLAVFILTLLTTVCLQILANLANDFGDTEHGADTSARVGPKRMIQQGLVSKRQMKIAIGTFVGLSSIAGVSLILTSFGTLGDPSVILMAAIGLAAIGSALKYTMGKNPYGYVGFGDGFVFIFFGLVGVGGTYFMYTHYLPVYILLPAAAIGLFSVGVLSINNMRDRKNDAATGKRTLAVLLGQSGSRIYHLLIISIGILLSVIYTLIWQTSRFWFLSLTVLPFVLGDAIRIFRTSDEAQLDPYLKRLSIMTLLYAVLFWISVNA